MKFVIFLSTLIAASFLTSPARASDYLDHCDRVLESGIRNNYSVDSLNLYKDYLREILSYSRDELADYVTTKDSSIAVPIPIAKTILDAEASNSATGKLLQQLRTKYSSDLTQEITEQDFESVASDVIDKNILNAWNQCIEDIGTRSGGIVYQVNGRENEVFSVTYRYVPDKESDPRAVTVTGLTVTGGGTRHIPTRIKEGTVLRRYTGYTQMFRRTQPATPVSIQMDIEGQDGVKVSVAGLKPQDVIPVGTVITSVLPWSMFAQTANDSASFDPNTNKWAPCDARSIRGSELARLGGGPTTPDLRGVFTRGLNSFAADEPDPVAERQRDPDLRRKVGSFQDHSTGEHSHFFRGSGAALTTADNGSDRKNLWHDGDYSQSTERETHKNPIGETRPKNVAVYFYIKIN